MQENLKLYTIRPAVFLLRGGINHIAKRGLLVD